MARTKKDFLYYFKSEKFPGRLLFCRSHKSSSTTIQNLISLNEKSCSLRLTLGQRSSHFTFSFYSRRYCLTKFVVPPTFSFQSLRKVSPMSYSDNSSLHSGRAVESTCTICCSESKLALEIGHEETGKTFSSCWRKTSSLDYDQDRYWYTMASVSYDIIIVPRWVSERGSL